MLGGLAGLAVAAVILFLIFGSSGSRGGPIAQAATVSSGAAGYRMHMSVAVTSPELGVPVSAYGSGVVDLRDHASAFSLTMDLGRQAELAQRVGSTKLRLDMVMKDAVMYMKMPATIAPAMAGSGRSWLKVDLAKVSGVPGLSSLTSNAAVGDPTRILQFLRSVSDSVVNEGTARVSGFETTHYQAQVSISRMLAGLGSGSQRLLPLAQQALPAGRVPLEVWIDAQHLVRRVSLDLDLNLPSSSLREAVTLDVSDYGPQPPPAIPAPDQVLDVSSLPGVGS